MKSKVATPMDEQELHINFCPSEMGKTCEVYTTIPWVMKHLEKLVLNYPDECKLIKDDQYSYTAQIPFKLVKPRSPRVLSDEQRQEMMERLEQARNKKIKE